MKKLNLFLLIVAFLLGNHFLFSQAVDRLYLSTASTGRVYDITSLTGGALPTPITIPNSSGTPSNISTLAVGYDQPGGNPSTLVFINSNTAAGSTLYKNGTAISGTTIPAGVQIGGLATNNVPGTYFGNVYGFQPNTKNLYRIYPSGTAIPITSTDTDWNNGTAFGTDTFFDYQNNIYRFVNNGTARYLFKISIATGVAEKAISAPISGSASFANLPTASGIQGMAYLQGYVYVATTVNGAGTIVIRRINMFDGVSTTVATYTVSSSSNLDLATVPYYVPFTLTCNGISQSSTTIPFVEGVASNGIRSLNIPITNVYGPGTYTINIIGANFNSSSTVNITSSTTSINVPLVYDGGGSSGTRTLSVNLNGSSTACSVNVVVEKDTDKDTIPDYQDLDDDNDGILDDTELRCDYAPNVYPFTSGNGATKNQLLIFDWSGATLTNVNDTFTTSKIVNGVTYTAKATVVAKINTVNTVTGTGSAVANIINTYAGNQMFWRYANYGNTAADDLKGVLLFSLNNAVGNKLSIRFDITATKSGVNQIFDAIAFDGESTASSEKGVYTTNASNWTLVDYLGGTPAPTEASISGNQLIYDDTQTNGNSLFAYTRGTNISITGDYTYQGINGRTQAMGVGVWLYCDTDNDGTPSYLDTDSDGDGCPDALEGSEFVRRTHIHSLSLPTTDTNYPYRGQIKVTYNGTTTGTPAQIISTSTGANGVPQLVNVAGSNLNTTTNPSNLAGISDNTDGTADIGQNFGSSQNSLVRDPDCDRCFRPATTAGTTLPTNHGITALARAGGNTGEWPVRVNGAYTVLDAKTKGFVINRVPTSALTSITGVTGMMVYDTTVNCLKIYDGTSWNCYTKQTCNDSNP